MIPLWILKTRQMFSSDPGDILSFSSASPSHSAARRGEAALLGETMGETHLISWTRRCIVAITPHKGRGRRSFVARCCVCVLPGCCSLE